jgi:hypothetical protein
MIAEAEQHHLPGDERFRPVYRVPVAFVTPHGERHGDARSRIRDASASNADTFQSHQIARVGPGEIVAMGFVVAGLTMMQISPQCRGSQFGDSE